MSRLIWGLIAVVVAIVIVTIGPRPTRFERKPAATQSGREPAAAMPESTPTATADTTVSENAPTEAQDPAFQKWLNHEARQLDAISVNTEGKEGEMREVSKRLTPAQSRQLLRTAQSATAPAGEKILSTYMLVEGGLNSREELRQLIAAPVADEGPHEAHSEAEMSGLRDKSLRIMAVDGLAAQAKKDPRAREVLAKTIPDIQDPYVRGYAQDKLEEVSSH